MRKVIAATALAVVMTATPAYACHSAWKPVPHAIRAQFRADGQPLKGRCRIRYGDTTVIRCTYRGHVTTYSS